MKKTIFQFSKYSIIGVTATIMNIFLMWLMIDHLRLNTMISTAAIVTSLFYYKFFGYLMLDLIHNRIDKLLLINGISALLNWIGATILIDQAGWPAIITAPIVVGTLFILRFFAFKWTGLMK